MTAGLQYWNFYTSVCYDNVCILLVAAAFPAFVRAASTVLFGGRAKTRHGIRFVCARWRRYLWVAALEVLGALVIPESLAAIAVIGIWLALHKMNLDPVGIASPSAFLLLVPVGTAFFVVLWVGRCLSFSQPIAAVEQIYGFKALRRSLALTRNRRWSILLICLLAGILVWVLAAVLEFLVGLSLSNSLGERRFGALGEQVYAVTAPAIQFLATVVALSITSIVVTLFYYDQRVRKDGLDVGMMMQAAGLVAPAAAPDGETA